MQEEKIDEKSVVFISAIAGFIILVAIGIIVFSLVNSEETFVYFETDGGTIIQPLANEGNISKHFLPTPTKEGYIFEGWFKNSQFTVPLTENILPKENITLYAKWQKGKFFVFFDSTGGNEVESLYVNKNETIDTLPTPVRDDYIFIGWSLNESIVTVPFTFTFEDDITLIAIWKNAENMFTFLEYNDYIEITSYTGEEKTVNIPSQIKSKPVKIIGEKAFFGTNIDQIILPSTVKEIGKEAFMYCQISEIILSDGLEAINDSAFAFCDKLESLLLPNSVSKLGTKFF